MIPLTWFLAGWAVLLVIFAFATFLTVAMTIRYGLSCFSTYIATTLFLGVIAFVLFASGGYLLTVDWSQGFSLYSPSSFFP